MSIGACAFSVPGKDTSFLHRVLYALVADLMVRIPTPTLILSVLPIGNHRPGADELLHYV